MEYSEAQVPVIASGESSPSSGEAHHDVSDILVISGGTGFNDLVGATPGATYVMPISDNGGSSSEIIRVLGGPSIGDLRSRLTRLIATPSHQPLDVGSGSTRHQNAPPPQSNQAIYNLLSYRLPTTGKSREIKQEWMDILEGNHPLWRGIDTERKEVVRGFLVHFESEVLRRAHRQFNFRGGSIGNFFLAAAQKFFRSLQSAIFLFSATTQIHTSMAVGSKVLPVINTNHTATIAAELEDAEIIVGQCEISHPAPKSSSFENTNINATSRQMELSGSPASQLPGTPSSAAFDVFKHKTVDGFFSLSHEPGSHAQDSGLLTPGFGVPSHYPNQALGTSYDSMSASVDRLPQLDGAQDPSSLVKPLQLSQIVAGPNALSRPHVSENVAVYGYSQRRGLANVGTHEDGLEPCKDGRDSGDVDNAGRRGTEAGGAEDEADEAASGNLVFSKDERGGQDLPSRIRRIFYVNTYGHEIFPAPNPAFVSSLLRCRTLIYSCGSLWTSLVPCLCLRGVAAAIARSPSLRHKVLLLNSLHDRETAGLSASDFVRAISSALNQPDHPDTPSYPPSDFITHIVSAHSSTNAHALTSLPPLPFFQVYFPDGQVETDTAELQVSHLTETPWSSHTSDLSPSR
jgi:2-phospho-L-lactate transferase/gluconeogenesis factor (CofD/UPF0052 family)